MLINFAEIIICHVAFYYPIGLICVNFYISPWQRVKKVKAKKRVIL